MMNELHLFAGAGGGILAGQLLGHRTVCAVEFEPYAQAVLVARQNDGSLPPFPIWDDVRTFDGKPWRGIVDLVAGGFPCQDISAAGKGAGIDGERSGMWSHMARIVGEVRPRFVFVENSPMLVGRGLARVIGDLAALGYDCRWGVLGADDVGAPHERKRLWLVANANGSQDNSVGADRELGRQSLGREKQAAQQDNWATDHNCTGGCGAVSPDALANGGQEKNLAYATGEGLERVKRSELEGLGDGSAYSGQTWDVSSADLPHDQRGRLPGGSPAQSAEFDAHRSWWGSDPADNPESELGRMAHGVANRVDRLKAIGNGQVPIVAATAWQILSERLAND